MSLPVPLGVRIYSYGRVSMDRWVTQWVSDLSFRSVIPGGFASATIKMTRPRMSQTPEVITGTATASGASSTPDYLVCSDADAADINVGDRVWIYTSGGAIRFGGARFRITSKPSAFGFTNLTFTPNASGVTNTGDVMRAATPGHFAYADPVVFDEVTNLFNRVQVVDLRTMEIVWEGRIEDPQRDSDDDTWTLGCLGSMVVASDIKRPIFYIDGDLDSWIPYEFNKDSVDMGSDQNSNQLVARWSANQWVGGTPPTAGPEFHVFHHERAMECDVYLGRFDITYDQTEDITAGTTGHLATVTNVYDGAFANAQLGVDVTLCSAARTRKANAINAGSSFTSSVAQIIGLFIGNNNTSGADVVTTGDSNLNKYINPHVQIQRMDINGTALTTSASYPGDYVTVEQVVRDVVGRYLNNGWYTHGANTPHTGQVRPADIYIDTSSTKQITNLSFFDGATAADVLNELMKTGDNQYWAIWESNYEATDGTGGLPEYGFRFEWAKWPSGWGYLITSADGLAEQPSGENAYNFLYYQWRTNSTGTDENFYYSQNYWDASVENRHLADNLVVRGTTIRREEVTDSSTAFTDAASTFAGLQATTNAGTVTVKRPVNVYDAGANSNSGASRTVDPWQIRPGKLARITDMVVPAKAHDFSHGTTAPPIELDGTVFKVVATEYSAADNSCRLELDQVTTWRTETQIADSAAKKSTLVVKG